MLKETRCNVLIVSDNGKFNAGIGQFLLPMDFETPDYASSFPQASNLLAERNYDMVIVNGACFRQGLIQFALNTADSYPIGILLLVRQEEYNEVFDKTHEYGIISLSNPLSYALLTQSVQILVSTQAKMQVAKDNSKVPFKEKMKEIQLINEAKVSLMKYRKMNENEAHKYIEQTAMNKRLKKSDVAKAVIKHYQ